MAVSGGLEAVGGLAVVAIWNDAPDVAVGGAAAIDFSPDDSERLHPPNTRIMPKSSINRGMEIRLGWGMGERDGECPDKMRPIISVSSLFYPRWASKRNSGDEAKAGAKKMYAAPGNRHVRILKKTVRRHHNNDGSARMNEII